MHLEHCGFRLPLARFTQFVSFGSLDGEFRLGFGHCCLRLVFALDGLGVRPSHFDAHFPLGRFHLHFLLEGGLLLADRLFLLQLGDLYRLISLSRGDFDRLFPLGFSDADFAHLFVVGHIAASLLDRLGRRLFSNRVDIA